MPKPSLLDSSDVTYWPSTKLSIEKQVPPVEDITLTCGWVEFGADATPTRSRWTSNNSITRCHSWSQLVGVSVAVRGSGNQLLEESLGPHDPLLSSPAEWERNATIVRGNWGQYVAVCSVSNSPLTHNRFATLSNKMWEVYFSKEVCSFVHYCWLCFRIYMYTYSCTTAIQQWFDCTIARYGYV